MVIFNLEIGLNRNLIENVVSFSEELADDAIEFLKSIISIKSYSKSEGTIYNKHTIVSKIYDFARKLPNVDVYAQDVHYNNRDVSQNIICKIDGGYEKSIILDAHMDVVGEGDPRTWYNSDPFSGEEGEVEYIGGKKVIINIGKEHYITKIRDQMDKIWGIRKYKKTDVIYGRGSYDNKGGLVSLLYSLKVFSHLIDDGIDIPGTILVIFSVDEEEDMKGAKEATKWIRNNIKTSIEKVRGVVVEGSYGYKVLLGHKGLVQYVIRTRGESTHAATPYEGKNAVELMCKLLSSLENKNDEIQRRLSKYFRDVILGNIVLTPGTTIVGGGIEKVVRRKGIKVLRKDVNVVPDWCEATVDVRTVRGKEYPYDNDMIPMIIKEVINKFIRERYVDIDFTLDIIKNSIIHPYVIGRTLDEAMKIDILKIASRISKETLGYDPGIGIALGASNAYIYYYNGGILTLSDYGPAGGLSHSTHEYVEKEQVIKGIEIYTLLSLDYLYDKSA